MTNDYDIQLDEELLINDYDEVNSSDDTQQTEETDLIFE